MKQRSRFSLNPAIGWMAFALGILAFTVYMIYKAIVSERKIFSLDFLAILLGLVFEYKRITEKWSTILWTALAAIVPSFWILGLGAKAQLSTDDYLQAWPYAYLGSFVLIAIVVKFFTVTRTITEGISLLLTLAVNYWIIL